MLYFNIILYIVSFLLIWMGSGLIVSAATKFSHKLRLSPFAFSFVFLGLLTSTPEFSVGLRSIADKTPQIFVGNLLGGIIVLFLVIIPLLAVLGNGISLKHELDNKTLLMTLGVILAPSAFVLDNNVSTFEGVIMIIMYLLLLFVVERKNGIFDRDNSKILDIRAYSPKDIFKIFAGIGLVFIASNMIVDKTIYFGELLNVPVFYIGLIIIALGTDLPELSLAIRSVVSGNREVAMGDYIGAASASTLLFGIFTLLNNGEVLEINNFLTTFIFTLIALSLFYIFFKTKNYISKKQGGVLLCIYILFVILEFMGK